MTHKQSRNTQRALEKALFGRPPSPKARPETAAECVARVEALLAGTLGRATRMQLTRELAKARARVAAVAAIAEPESKP